MTTHDRRTNAHKLTWEKVEAIRRRAGEGEARSALAREFGISHAMVSMVVTYQRWQEKPLTDPPGKRTCTVCKLCLPVAQFSKETSRPSGLQVRCRTCQSKRQVEFRAVPSNRKRMQDRQAATDRKRRGEVAALKEARGCEAPDCTARLLGGRETDPRCLQFHHRDPSTKLFSIGAEGRNSWTRILAEIAKCDVLCANCHWKQMDSAKLAE